MSGQERVDLDHWKKQFPLAELRHKARQFVLNRQASDPSLYANQQDVERHIALMQPGGDIIGNPYELAVVEQLREEAARSGNLGAAVATDVVLFRHGESEQREITKVGGLPYWPASKPWPRSRNGQLMTFVAQLCFADSRDIIGDLPGDVLAIFEAGNYIADWDGDDPSSLRCEWLPLGETELVAQSPLRHYAPACGALYRTADYPKDTPAFESYNCSWHLSVLEGTKIGGVPAWIQGPANLPGRFVCSLGSWTMVFDDQLKAALGPWETAGPPQWGDMGSIYFFVDSSGQTHWAIQCY